MTTQAGQSQGAGQGRPQGGPGGQRPPYQRSGPGGGQRGGPGGARRGRPRYFARRKVCTFCVDKVKAVDYKQVDRMRRFMSDRFKIEARRKTGVCATHQRQLSTAIKRARHLAMMPFAPNNRIRNAPWS